MTGKSEVSPATALGLPIPDATAINDPELREYYERFVQHLLPVAGGSVILADPYVLSVPGTDINTGSAQGWYESLPSADRKRLLLLSILSLPFDSSCLWPKGVGKFIDDELVSLEWTDPGTFSLAEGARTSFGIGTLEGRRMALEETALRRLFETLPRRAPIETIASEFIGGQPGNYGYQMWQVARWSDDWAAVYGITDAGYEAGYPFPWILGFCRLDAVERNFVTLLREGWARFDPGFYYTHGKVLSRWRIAPLALVADDGDEGPPWDFVNDLLSLDDVAIARVLEQCEAWGSLPVRKRLREIRRAAEDVGLSLAQLITKAIAKNSLAALDDFLTECAEEYEVDQYRKARDRTARLAPWSVTIERWTNDIVGTRPSGMNAGIVSSMRAGRVRHFLEEYVLEHRGMPSGIHDIGRIRNGPNVGVVNFDAVAARIFD